MMRFFHAWVIVVCALVLTGCATIYNPATERQEYLFINSREEVQIGRGLAQEVVRKEYPLLDDAAKQRRVQQIGQRIVQVSDRRDIMYQFGILDSPDFNAFALPGGFVYIYNGLFQRLDETGTAAVLAHEVGHVAARHSVKKMQATLGYELLLGIAVASLSNNHAPLAQNIGQISNTVFGLLSKGYGRQDELLADKLAVKYLKLAGYDPHALVSLLELLQKESGPSGRVFEVLSDHPRMEERIRKAKEEIQKLSP